MVKKQSVAITSFEEYEKRYLPKKLPPDFTEDDDFGDLKEDFSEKIKRTLQEALDLQ